MTGNVTPAAKKTGSMEQLSFLILEDEPIIRRQLRREVERSFPDAKITDTGTYAGAIQLIENDRFDFALLDINIDGKNAGLDVARAIRKITDTYVIFITAYSDDHLIDSISNLENFTFLTKPFNSTQIRVSVQCMLIQQLKASRSAEEREKINSLGSKLNLETTLEALNQSLSSLESGNMVFYGSSMEEEFERLKSTKEKISSFIKK